MTLHMAEKQSSESWQEGVRWENRMRVVERDIEDIKSRIWWFYILVIGIGILAIGTLVFHK